MSKSNGLMKICVLIIAISVGNPIFSQVVFNETFDEGDDAMEGNDDVGGVSWTTTCPDCIDDGDFFKIQGGALVGQDTNGPASFESGVIDISSCGFIEVEFDLSEEGTMEACGTGCNSVDYVQLEYNIDGGGWETPADASFCGGECADVLVIQSDDIDGGSRHYATGCVGGGEEIQIRITVQAWAASERWIVDNLEVSCSEGPELSAGDDIIICEGTEIVLEADNPDGAVISWSDGVTDGVAFTQGPGTEEYTVSGTLGECTATDIVSVTVIGAEMADVSPAGPYLITDPAVILTGTPDGGEWSADCGDCVDPATGEFDPGEAGVGSWTVCYEVGVEPCKTEDCITIIVTSGDCDLEATASFNNPTCFAYTDGSVTISTTGATGDVIFVVTNEDGDVVNFDNSNTANTLGEGWYYFTVSDDFPCEFSDSIYLEDPDEMTFDLVLSNPLCYGDMTGYAYIEDVENATGDPAALSYFWTPNPSGVNGIGEDTLYSVGEGEFNITINDENGCSVSESFELIYPDSLKLVEFGAFPAFCRLYEYQKGNGVVFASASDGTGEYDYVWENISTGETTINTTWGGLNPGQYRITVTDDNGCTLSRNIQVDSLNPKADFELSSTGFTAEWEGASPLDVHFTNISENFANPNDPLADTNFIWNFGMGGNVISHDLYEEFDMTYTPGEYEVCLTVINSNGCTDSLCELIRVFEPFSFVPVNVFTPNLDGKNDLFTFRNYASSVETFDCVIVNRWGIVVAEFDSITDEWNGDLPSGNAASAGVYFYSYVGETFLGEIFEGQGNVQLMKQ